MNEEQLKFQSLFLTVYHSPHLSLPFFIYVEENANVEGIRSDERTLSVPNVVNFLSKQKRHRGFMKHLRSEPKEVVLRPNP